MLSNVKAFVKARPHLYDILKVLRRYVPSEPDPAYEFFDTFSKLHNRDVSFIQIGASDGLRNDPIREFIVRDRWRGVLVEPLPTAFSLLQENYAYLSNPKLVFVNAAISDSHQDRVPFYSFNDKFLDSKTLEKRLDYLQKSSFDRSHVEKFVQKDIANVANIIKEIDVPCLTLSELVDRYLTGEQIDLLVIDAEGHEFEIIKQIDCNSFWPEAIFFESHHLHSEKCALFEFLNESGYQIAEIRGDAIARRPKK